MDVLPVAAAVMVMAGVMILLMLLLGEKGKEVGRSAFLTSWKAVHGLSPLPPR